MKWGLVSECISVKVEDSKLYLFLFSFILNLELDISMILYML